ncbi:ankyrin repeat domain-containing protein [Fimbriiglobus ruber]|uniref:Ankyrin n=1 Tax=Fimbriiglobus ruber TaxID=1908690 RepID=A0A225DSS3_9BACT|nr:ankyrin repeat domain-containing protein [Fimbriiglobus ruber]OWK44361.1 Ankyrin [Fimbriiglobus ruber]
MDLKKAVREGNLEEIRSLFDAGADIRYVRPRGYTVMTDVMFRCSIAEDSQLIPIVRFLIEQGADLNASSDYGESGLSVSSGAGRLDVVRVLLEAGADPAPLEWTLLHLVVAFGSLERIRLQIQAGDDLNARDRWGRTAWLMSVLTGDIEKAELLLTAGANIEDRGRDGKTPLMCAAKRADVAMTRWLLERGADPNSANEHGYTVLHMAAGAGSQECVRLLLNAGADVHRRSGSCSMIGSVIGSARDLETMRLLVAAGADINDIYGSLRAKLTRLPHDGSIVCTPDEYQAAKHRIFGRSNPERMNFPFWKAMVSGGGCAYRARAQFDEGRIDGEAVWCFDRFGTSLTELPDGRIIEIAGEYEDFYDPDFCIYNDVFVHYGDGAFDIYGYPKDIFPPTDFHTATLVDEAIYIVGNLGYPELRRYGTTQVCRFDIGTLAIEPVETTGDGPGWISSHKAKLVDNRIELTGGKVCRLEDGEENYRDNSDTFALDIPTMTWSRRT